MHTHPARFRIHVGLAAATSLILLLAVEGADASLEVPPPGGAVPLPAERMVHPRGPLDASGLHKQAAWARFRAEHPGWDAQWNPWTGTPHRALGPAIRVAEAVPDASRATALAERFLRETEVSRVGDLDLRSVATVRGPNGVWYANFHQYHDGLRVLNTDITVRLHENGKVLLFGSDARPDIQVSTRPTLSAAEARIRARAGLTFSAATDEVRGGDELFLLPVDDVDGTTHHLVRRVQVRQKNPDHSWRTYVDAHTGEVLWRYDRIRHGTVSGKVTGDVKLGGPATPQETVEFRDARLIVAGEFVETDPNGDWSLSNVFGQQNARFLLEGPWINVERADGVPVARVDIAFDGNTSPTVDHHWVSPDAHLSERMVFYHTNFAHAYLKAIDPGFTGMDFSVLAYVMNPWDACNASYNEADDVMTFYAADSECNNSAHLADIIYHEYTHGINEHLYQMVSGGGMVNGALNEGTADVFAAFVENDPLLGQGLRKAHNDPSRNADNDLSWPDDYSGSIHSDGQIISGAFWDLRERVGESVAGPLAHFSKYGAPDDPSFQIACQELLLEVLVAADDNGDLADQTPNWADILESFNLHGIGPSLYLTLDHTPLDDTTLIDQPIPVSAAVTSSSTFFSVHAASTQLVYSLNGGPDQVLPLVDQGGGIYTAEIPGQPVGTVVAYHLTASMVDGTPVSSPARAPIERHRFLVGTGTQVMFDDFESGAGGWTSGAPDDDAVTGFWVRVDPVGSIWSGQYSQSEDDHTPGGTHCWVTGNGALPDDRIGEDDVDEGKVTLLSPVFDATGLTNPVVRYYRWYRNDLGINPNSDIWRVDISNDGGGTWTSVENTLDSNPDWTRVVFRIEDLVAPTATMQMRFVAEDADPQSVVEAGIDDWELISFDGVTAIDDPAPQPVAFTLHQNHPNPFNPSTEIRFGVPRGGPVRLVVYDVAGRRVRTLVEGVLAAGEHRAVWRGRDDAGSPVASGIYLYRLTTADDLRTRRMVLLK